MARKDVSDYMVCLAYREEPGFRKMWPQQWLAHQTGECQKVCYRAMERAFSRGLVEFGISLQSGWLTDKGKRLLVGKSFFNDDVGLEIGPLPPVTQEMINKGKDKDRL